MEAVVKKWGNSLGIRIPAVFAKQLSLKDGLSVDINNCGNEIIMKPTKKSALSEMLDSVTEQNIHREIETGRPVGKEIW